MPPDTLVDSWEGFSFSLPRGVYSVIMVLFGLFFVAWYFFFTPMSQDVDDIHTEKLTKRKKKATKKRGNQKRRNVGHARRGRGVSRDVGAIPVVGGRLGIFSYTSPHTYAGKTTPALPEHAATAIPFAAMCMFRYMLSVSLWYSACPFFSMPFLTRNGLSMLSF